LARNAVNIASRTVSPDVSPVSAEWAWMPSGGVRVGQAVGDVEPSEVVEQISLAGDVVAHHPFTDGLGRRRRVHRRRRHLADRCRHGGNDRPAVAAEQDVEQRPSSRHVGSTGELASAARSVSASTA
jgi:hypothetical protein